MFGKIHSESTKKKIRNKLSKHPYGVGIYDLNDNLISKYKNNTELAKHLNISKVTLSKYLNSALFFCFFFCQKKQQKRQKKTRKSKKKTKYKLRH